MTKSIALLTLALSMPAAAFQAPATVPGTAVPNSAQEVVAQAVSANQKLAAMVDGARGALPDTKAMIDEMAAASEKIAAAQKALDGIAASINAPRPDASGKAEAMMDAVQSAEDAVTSATPNGHSLADYYDPMLARAMEFAPYGDAAWADVALSAAAANMTRALVELRKQAYALGYELRYRLHDTELGDRDLRRFNYDSNMNFSSGMFKSTRKAIEARGQGAPADFIKKLGEIKDLCVFGQPRSA